MVIARCKLALICSSTFSVSVMTLSVEEIHMRLTLKGSVPEIGHVRD